MMLFLYSLTHSLRHLLGTFSLPSMALGAANAEMHTHSSWAQEAFFFDFFWGGLAAFKIFSCFVFTSLNMIYFCQCFCLLGICSVWYSLSFWTEHSAQYWYNIHSSINKM